MENRLSTSGPVYSDTAFFAPNQAEWVFPNSGPVHNENKFFENTCPDCSFVCNTVHQEGERYSQKVFIGGLPSGIDEDGIVDNFGCFGSFAIDMPKNEDGNPGSPSKGYAFLLFNNECSVHALVKSCIKESNQLYIACILKQKKKLVQVRPWSLSSATFIMNPFIKHENEMTAFIGGVPRPIKAVDLATAIDQIYGGVCYVEIDTEPDFGYPKRTGRVVFSNIRSYIAAINSRFLRLKNKKVEKMIEMKPYIQNHQNCGMCLQSYPGSQICFCANMLCMRFYCICCWLKTHPTSYFMSHKRMVRMYPNRCDNKSNKQF